jgi:hypothetical protein
VLEAWRISLAPQIFARLLPRARFTGHLNIDMERSSSTGPVTAHVLVEHRHSRALRPVHTRTVPRFSPSSARLRALPLLACSVSSIRVPACARRSRLFSGPPRPDPRAHADDYNRNSPPHAALSLTDAPASGPSPNTQTSSNSDSRCWESKTRHGISG